ncbi:MAG: hypothetical protein GQ477_05330 [Nanohaloarchaea archaeon]|nr:hypothetical protein [Candidatus Nanohaloarchaea archaeon]
MTLNSIENVETYTKRILPEEVICHKDSDKIYKDIMLFYAPKSEIETENDNYSPHKLENMLGVVRIIMDKNYTELDCVAYFIESIYDVCLSENKDSDFKRYIEYIYEPKSIRPFNKDDTKKDWFKFLKRYKRINEDTEPKIDTNHSNSGNNLSTISTCTSSDMWELYNKIKKRDNFPTCFN